MNLLQFSLNATHLFILFDAYLLGSQGLKFEGYIRKQILRYESRDCR